MADITYNDFMKQMVVCCLGTIPWAGSIIAGLTNMLWPSSKEDVWGSIKARVEQLIDEKLDEAVYTQVAEDLKGLNSVVSDYISYAASGSAQDAQDAWHDADAQFDSSLPHFQDAKNEVLLLPLFAQFANLNLSLLRNGVLDMRTWDPNDPAPQKVVAQKLTDRIKDFTAYAERVYQKGLDARKANKNAKRDDHNCEPFRYVNSYIREMTLMVLDFSALWSYLDISQYPNPVVPYVDREIYSDPIGTCDDSGPINLPSPATGFPSELVVWAYALIDAVRLTYPANQGPGGVTTTPRLGDVSGGTNVPPRGGTFDLTQNPIVIAGGKAGTVPNSFEFTFADGTTTGVLGGYDPTQTPAGTGGTPFSIQYKRELLSSIHINGVSEYYGSADSAVFGFRFRPDFRLSLEVVESLYITDPKQSTLADLHTEFPFFSLSDAQTAATQDDWDKARTDYWGNLSGSAGNS
jgi:hypothetical protein